VLDRAGNVRADPVEIDALGTGVSVDPSHHLSALSVGRFSIRARSGSVEDTAWISVVPRGALAMVEGTSLHVMNLDGSEGRVLSTGPSDASVDVNAPTWVPGNDALLVLRHDLGSPSRLLRIPLTGGPVLFLPDTIRPKIGALHAYHLSPDGAALFLAGSRCNIAEIVYRFDLSSSDLRRLSPPGDDCWNPIDAFPSPAPDGQHLVFVDSQDRSSPVLALLDVVSATRTSLLVPGSRAVWSPAGEWIAFSDQGAIKLVKPDGTGLRQLSQPGTAYDPSFNWSPDGMWILARAQTRWGSYPDRLELIRVSDGLRLPLVFAAGRDPDLTSRVF
jgi:Tol biopolymer transport system component